MLLPYGASLPDHFARLLPKPLELVGGAWSGLELKLDVSISLAGGTSPAHSFDCIRIEHVSPKMHVGKGSA
jgi:hypothetical protein